MKIVIVGMGGVGGYFGGKLAKAYVPSGAHQVYFVARGDHLAAIKRKGLAVVADDGDFIAVPTLATDSPADAGIADIVLFCVKSYDFEEAARRMEAVIGSHTLVIPLQNGVDKRGWMENVLGRGVSLDGCVYMAAHIEQPGVIRQAGGSRKLIFGRDPEDVPRLKPVRDLFAEAGINAELVEDIRLPVWTKYIMICSLAAATSYFRETTGRILEDSGKKSFLEGLVREVEQVARGEGVAYPPDIFEKTMGIITSFPYDTKTSMQRDFEQGRRTELDTFSGAIVRMAGELGMDAPLHRKVYETLKGRS